MVSGIGQPRQHRGHHHMATQARLANRRDQRKPRLRGRGAGFQPAVQRRIPDRQRYRHTDVDPARGVSQLREIPAEQGAFGQDRERCAEIGQGADDARHQRIPSLGPLVRIGIGAQGDGLPRPGRTAQFTAQHLGDVGLDHHLGVEVATAVELQVLVGGPGETVPARVRTPAVAVDGEPKRQHGRRRDLVQGRLAQHLVKGDSVELRGPHTAHQSDALQARQRTVVDRDALTCPAHTLCEHTFDTVSSIRFTLHRTAGTGACGKAGVMAQNLTLSAKP